MTTIDMWTYGRLGEQRRIFDTWLTDADLINRWLVEIRFGEGIHRCRYIVTRADLELGRDKPILKDGTVVYDWFSIAGPLPPVSVLEQARRLQAERTEDDAT